MPVELRKRDERGEEPKLDDYVSKFPDHQDIVNASFQLLLDDQCTVDHTHDIDQGTTHDQGDTEAQVDTLDRETTKPEDTLALQTPAANRIGDFEILRELGRGGFGVVYEAIHNQRTTRVALKTLHTGHIAGQAIGEQIHSFRSEFRALCEVYHPNLVGMQSLEADGSQWFFTMDIVDGTDFLSHVRPNGVLDEQRLRNAAEQIVLGVAALHARGILHRDLKPSNVLVDEEGKVKILDFGLVAKLQRPGQPTGSETSAFAGTPRYAAPEQFFGEWSPAADWYAFGTMLYEAMQGHAPYGGSVSQIAVKKTTEPPPLLTNANLLPSDLVQLSRELLNRTPDKRPTLQSIANILSVDLTENSSSTAGLRESSLGFEANTEAGHPQALVGRHTQLAQLAELEKSFTQELRPRVVWVVGKSGEGKSTLVEHFLRPHCIEGKYCVLSGRCYDRETVPFKVIDVIIEALIPVVQSLPREQLKAWLPHDIDLLATLFPTLRRIEVIGLKPQRNTHLDERQLRYRAFFALRDLLARISQWKPFVFFVDDLQWGDSDSAQVLSSILMGDDAPAVLFLGSYRVDEAEHSAFLQRWQRQSADSKELLPEDRVEVKPLSESEWLELAKCRLGIRDDDFPDEFRQSFADANGNPYFLEQLLEGFDPVTRKLQGTPIHEILERKLSGLPSESRELMKAVAIAGQVVALNEASKVAGFDDPMYSIVTHMRSEKLVRLVGTEKHQYVDTFHDKVRESTLQMLSEGERRELHVRFGELLEEQTQTDALTLLQQLAQRENSEFLHVERLYDMAYHFQAADDPRSFAYQFAAGERAVKTYAVEEALRFLQRAEKLMPGDLAGELKYRLYAAMGRLYLWRNEPEQAVAAYEQAELVAENDLDRASARAGIAQVHNQTGSFDQSVLHFDKALDQIGKRRRKSAFGQVLFGTIASLTLLVVPRRFLRARSDHQVKLALLQHEIFYRMSSFIPEKGFFASIECFLSDSLATLRTGKDHLAAHGYSHSAWMFSGYGAPWIGNILLRRCSQIESQLNDPSSRGPGLYSMGLAHYFLGELSQAEQCFQEAVPLLDRSGNSYLQMVTLHMLRHIGGYRGSAGEEEGFARGVLELAEATSNVQGKCWGSYDLASALARQGEIASAIKNMQDSFAALTNERFQMTEPIRASTYGFVLLQASQFSAAREAATHAWHIVFNCPIDVSMLCLPVLIESIAGPNWISNDTKSESNSLRKLVRWATLAYYSYPSHQPHLQRVVGRAHWTLGNQRKAIRAFHNAIRLAAKKAMNYQLARSLLDLAAVAEENRSENRATAIDLLKQMESVIPHAEAWLLGDQFDESVVAPRFDLHEWEQDNGPVRMGKSDVNLVN